MHPTILAQRKAAATNRIVQTAGSLVAHVQGDPALVQALEPKGVKDPAAAEMMRLEGLADLLEEVARLVVAPPPGVTVVTEEPGPMLDDLPAPVIEDELAGAKPRKPRVPRKK